jgi:hypothetical protein
MADRVRPLGLECPQEGGTQIYSAPTEINPNQDGVDCNALFLQSASSADSRVFVDRDSTDQGLRFTEPTVGVKKLNRLVSNSLSDTQSHQALLDIIHFLDDGPGDGWASGAVRVRVGTGPNAGGWVWYTSTAMTARIIDMTVTYPAGSILPQTKAWRLYAANGTSVIRTLTDTYTWNGPLLTQKARSWT